MNLTLECEQEVDGRWLAEVPQLPGVLAYGRSPNDAMAKAQVLALRVLAERLEHGEAAPLAIHISLPLVA
jgi:predicted RNase H-like HicB family nuclease